MRFLVYFCNMTGSKRWGVTDERENMKILHKYTEISVWKFERENLTRQSSNRKFHSCRLLYGGADKSLARPGRKEATATKL
jgi:hypothetical protein